MTDAWETIPEMVLSAGERFGDAEAVVDGATRLTFTELTERIRCAAGAFASAGIGKGDRVAIYMPLVPELAIAMLACARIGAIHSVVFGGFSAESLSDRIDDAKAKVLITADGGYRRGQIVPLKAIADQALDKTASIEHVVVLKRGGDKPIPVTMALSLISAP